MQYSSILDEDSFYQNPRCLIETRQVERITINGSIHSYGKDWSYKLIEDERLSVSRSEEHKPRCEIATTPEVNIQPSYSDTEKQGPLNTPNRRIEDSDESELTEGMSSPKILNRDAAQSHSLSQYEEIQDADTHCIPLMESVEDEFSDNSLINPTTPPHSPSLLNKQIGPIDEWN